MVKWNYALLGRGVFMANYERNLNEHFTLELGVGITYWDFIYMARYDAHDSQLNFPTNPNPYGTQQSLVTNLSEDATKHFGYAIEMNPRFYFEKDEFEGLYISGYASYRQYNFGLQVVETNSSSGNTNIVGRDFDNLGYSIIDLGGKMGYQVSWRWNDAVYADIYLGAAYRQVNMHTLLKTQTSSDYTYSEYYQALSMPSFMFGVKIGYAF